jgi:hypothetical protein
MKLLTRRAAAQETTHGLGAKFIPNPQRLAWLFLQESHIAGT